MPRIRMRRPEGLVDHEPEAFAGEGCIEGGEILEPRDAVGGVPSDEPAGERQGGGDARPRERGSAETLLERGDGVTHRTCPGRRSAACLPMATIRPACVTAPGGARI